MDVGYALRTLWKDTCTVVEYTQYLSENNSTQYEEKTVLEKEPCKLSFESVQAVNQTDTVAHIVQSAKLFIDKDINIKPGSKIIVCRNGNVFEFKQSGLPGIFTHHQEIMLVPYEDYS